MIGIVTPRLGRLSETFIHRYVFDLAPRETVVVAESYLGDPSEKGRQLPTFLDLGLKAQGNRDPNETHHLALAARFIVKHQVEVLFGQHLNNSIPWLGLAKKLSIPFCVRAHGYDVSAALGPTGKVKAYLRYASARKVITMSDYSRQRLVDMGLPPEKIAVVPYGVPVPEKPILRKLRKGSVRCLAVGRLVEKKGPTHLIGAFDLALRECPELKLEILGDGPLREDVEKEIQSRGLQDKVHWTGEVSPSVVLQKLKDADIFLQHSVTASNGDQEGLPVSILEAMAHALPIVSTNHAGIPEAVKCGESGFLSPERDEASMAISIRNLCQDSKLRQRMGHQGWETARRQFSWEQERHRILRLLMGHADA